MTDVTVKAEDGKFKVLDDDICYSVEPTIEEANRVAELLKIYYIYLDGITLYAKNLLKDLTPEQQEFIRRNTLGKFEVEF